jgi:hypothetical protein
MQFQEHVKSTILHLQIIQAFLEVFYGWGTLLKWMEWSSFVVYMIYFGTKYIINVNMDTTCKINGWLKSPLLIVWFFVIRQFYILWWCKIYFLTCLLFYIKLV